MYYHWIPSYAALFSLLYNKVFIRVTRADLSACVEALKNQYYILV